MSKENDDCDNSCPDFDNDTPQQRFLIELKAEARRYCNEHFTNPTESDYLTIENAMLIGAQLQVKKFGSRAFC
jgi:hypothetical protein